MKILLMVMTVMLASFGMFATAASAAGPAQHGHAQPAAGAARPSLPAPSASTTTAEREQARGEEATIQTVKVKEVMSGFTFKDVLGRTFKLVGVMNYAFDTPSEQAEFDSTMKGILKSWLTTPGEAVFVMHNGRRDKDGAIPGLVFVGTDFNVSLNYIWRSLAVIDDSAPAWFNLETFTSDAREENMPDYLAQELGIARPLPAAAEPAANTEDALAILLYKDHDLVYSGYVFPKK